jgi:hypothetical protein
MQKISTQELQRAHFTLGNHNENYQTTSLKNYSAKEIVKLYLTLAFLC